MRHTIKNHGQRDIFILLSMISFTCILFINSNLAQTITFEPQDFNTWEGLQIYQSPKSFFEEQKGFEMSTDILNSGFRLSQEHQPGCFLVLPYNNETIAYSYQLQNFSEDDTIIIKFEEFKALAKSHEKEREYAANLNKELEKVLRNQYSGVFNLRINRSKLKNSLHSGEFFDTPYDKLREIKDFRELEVFQLDSIWIRNFFISNAWDFELFFLGLDKMNQYIDKTLINCGFFKGTLRMPIRSFFLSKPFNERKIVLDSLFNSLEIKSELTCQFDEWKTLYYAYLLVNYHGVSSTDDNPNTVSISYLENKVQNLASSKHKDDFLDFLERIKANPFAEEISMLSLERKEVILQDHFKKSYIILDFWATWCRPCIRAFPELKSFNDIWKERITMLSISVDKDFDRFHSWVSNNDQYDWEFLNMGIDQHFLSSLNVRAFPTYIIYHPATSKLFGPFHKVSDLEDFFQKNASE